MKKYLLLLLTLIPFLLTGCATGKLQPSVEEAQNVEIFLANDGYYIFTYKERVIGKSQAEIRQQENDMWAVTFKIADTNGYKYFGFINNDSVDFRNGFPINTYANLVLYKGSKNDGKKNSPFFSDNRHYFKIMYFTEKPSGVFVFDIEKVKDEVKEYKNNGYKMKLKPGTFLVN